MYAELLGPWSVVAGEGLGRGWGGAGEGLGRGWGGAGEGLGRGWGGARQPLSTGWPDAPLRPTAQQRNISIVTHLPFATDSNSAGLRNTYINLPQS